MTTRPHRPVDWAPRAVEYLMQGTGPRLCGAVNSRGRHGITTLRSGCSTIPVDSGGITGLMEAGLGHPLGLAAERDIERRNGYLELVIGRIDRGDALD